MGAVALGFWGSEAASARIHQRTQERRLESLTSGPRRAGGAARTEALRTGLVGRLEIARLGLATVVEEGVDQGTLRRAAGHLPGTAFPGETGNVVVAAHRDTFFRPLNAIRPGDSLRFVTPDGEFRYVVFALDVVEPASTDVLEAGDGHQATLITCYPFGYVGPARL
ncbi:MAG TPA: class D sortase, partial [Vicinamibacteria bacterium]